MPASYIALIDTKTPGPRYDVTPLFRDFAAFSALVEDLAGLVGVVECDVVAGIDALGFILGTALALRMRKGFVPIRKGGKLPVPTARVELVDYTGTHKALELRRDAITAGARLLVVDEWIETGAQAWAAIQLIEGCGGIIAGIATIHVDTNERTRDLMARYPCFQLWPEA
jgi:adenine phosphoribosyltransferase